MDLLDHVPDSLRSACGPEDSVNEKSPAELKSILPDAPIKLNIPCVVHGRACRMQRADLHTAGTPCTDHSTQGKIVMFAGAKARAAEWSGTVEIGPDWRPDLADPRQN